jgi:hypothetical protein
MASPSPLLSLSPPPLTGAGSGMAQGKEAEVVPPAAVVEAAAEPGRPRLLPGRAVVLLLVLVLPPSSQTCCGFCG